MDNIDSIQCVEKVEEKRSERKHKAKEKLKWKNFSINLTEEPVIPKSIIFYLWHDGNDMSWWTTVKLNMYYTQAKKKKFVGKI